MWAWLKTIFTGLAIASIVLAWIITVVLIATVMSWFFIPLTVIFIIWVVAKIYNTPIDENDWDPN